MKITTPWKLQGLVTSGDGVGVLVGVGVGVGVYVTPVTSIATPPQGLDDVGVGVGVDVGVDVGVGVGVKVTSQSKIASKSIVLQNDGVGVGGTQDPLKKKSSQRSGQVEIQGVLPNNKQDPSRTVDRHQQVSPVE